MKSSNKSKLYFLQEIIDISFLIVFFFTVLKLQYSFFSTNFSVGSVITVLELLKSHYKALLLFVFFWLLIANNVSLYENKRIIKFVDILKKLIYQILFFSIIVFSISGLKSSDLFSPKLGILYLLLLLFTGFVSRFIRFNYIKNLHLNDEDISKALVIDVNENTDKLIQALEDRKDLGIRVYKVLRKENIEILDNNVFFKNKNIESYIKKNKIDRIYISQKGEFDNKDIHKISKFLETLLLPIYYIPDSIYNGVTQLDLVYIDTLPILETKRFPLDLRYNLLFKKNFDIFFSIIVFILFLSWLFPIIAILILLDSKGPIFFKQRRNGLNGKEFTCYKFRTMKQSEKPYLKTTERNDPRITVIGKFLRKTSIDELPQFFNVLKGDMSIIGPRPHMVSVDHYYREIISKYNLRSFVKPGITGLSQVKGYRGAVDSNEDMEKRIRTDIFYVRNWSILLDFQIIYQTVVLIFKGDENAI